MQSRNLKENSQIEIFVRLFATAQTWLCDIRQHWELVDISSDKTARARHLPTSGSQQIKPTNCLFSSREKPQAYLLLELHPLFEVNNWLHKPMTCFSTDGANKAILMHPVSEDRHTHFRVRNKSVVIMNQNLHGVIKSDLSKK